MIHRSFEPKQLSRVSESGLGKKALTDRDKQRRVCAYK